MHRNHEDTSRTDPQEDRIAVCSLMHVTSVDYLQPT